MAEGRIRKRGTDADNDSIDRAEISILVVDDEPRMCASLQELLAGKGYGCRAAIGGEAAIDTLKQVTFDLVLLDLRMPGVGGREVMNHMKDACLDTDVIVVSGETTFDEAAWALKQGAHDFLRKPYAFDELLHSVEKCLRKRALEKENQCIQRRLISSEQRYRYFVNNSPDIIYMLDANGRFSFINDRAVTLLGYNQGDLLGRHYSEFVFSEDLSKARFAFDAHRTGSHAARDVEFRMLCKGDPLVSVCSLTSRLITVELSAMGVYEAQDDGKSQRFLGTYGVIRDVTERKRAEEIINYQLYHDVLTSLPNRALFWDRVEVAISRAKRNRKKLAVMFLDLDGFKVINDSLGHLTGDELLQAVSLRLRSCLRDDDTLARAGGDEFNILLGDIGSREDAAFLAERIINSLKRPVLLGDKEICVGLSIGIALYPDNGINVEPLMRHADVAMYHIKARGKNGYKFFNEDMIGHVSRHFSLERGLRQALEKNQFVLMYQPQYDTDSGAIVGVEALIRWQHPKEGLIAPGDFIPLAEETGLISDIGEWVLRTACAELNKWHQAGIANIRMAVNLSAAQLYKGDFVEKVLKMLKESELPGECLELEITENLLMRDMEHMVQKLRELTDVGVRVSVDDFGTGYSSLGYLQSLPLTMLKMDRSFVSRIESSDEQYSIVTAIVTMAKGLGLEVIAEGVETKTQLEYLRSIQCSQAQGFLFSPPVSADCMLEMLSPGEAH